MPKRTSQESMQNLTQSQSSQGGESSKGKKKTPEVNVNTAEFQRKVSEMVRYILFADRKKIGIKRPDIVKSVLKENPRIFPKVFQEACLKINQTFGLDVVTMETEDGKNRGYMLVNALDNGIVNSDQFLDWNEDSPQMGLLLIILCIIFMNDGALKDVNLWYTLKKIGVFKDEQHKVFGDVENLIQQEFTRKHYLEKEKINGPEGPTFCYSFGPRAQKEISKRTILEFVSQVYGFEDISKWKIRYEKMLEEEVGTGDVRMVNMSQDGN